MSRRTTILAILVAMLFVFGCDVGSLVSQQAAPAETSVAKAAGTAIATALAKSSSSKSSAQSPAIPTTASSAASSALGGTPSPTLPPFTPAPTVSASVNGKNIITNADAEAGQGAPNNEKVFAAPGWSSTEKFTVIQYGASGGFIAKDAPGPQNRGKNYFVGGPDNLQSAAKQTISVASSASAIDGGNVGYAFEGWIGGFADQNDNATVTASFMDDTGKVLGQATLGPVLAEERKSKDGLVLKSVKGNVPKGTRSIVVLMVFSKTAGSYNDGAVDNLSLVLSGS